MDAEKQARQQRKRQLLQELAELHLEEMAEAGDFDQTPHFCTIERAASGLGSQLSREIQARASREVAADCTPRAPCPTCRTLCEVTTKRIASFVKVRNECSERSWPAWPIPMTLGR